MKHFCKGRVRIFWTICLVFAMAVSLAEIPVTPAQAAKTLGDIEIVIPESIGDYFNNEKCIKIIPRRWGPDKSTSLSQIAQNYNFVSYYFDWTDLSGKGKFHIVKDIAHSPRLHNMLEY